MGCCNNTCILHEGVNEVRMESEGDVSVSFADLSISRDEDEISRDASCTEDQFISRLRSVSLYSIKYSNQIENAFLINSPIIPAGVASKAWDSKLRDSLISTTSSTTYLSSSSSQI